MGFLVYATSFIKKLRDRNPGAVYENLIKDAKDSGAVLMVCTTEYYYYKDK